MNYINDNHIYLHMLLAMISAWSGLPKKPDRQPEFNYEQSQTTCMKIVLHLHYILY